MTEYERSMARISSLRDQSWAAVREYREDIEQYADDPETPGVVRMALYVVLAELSSPERVES